MKHTISDNNKKNLGGREWLIAVELIPENQSEIIAIKNCEVSEATPEQKQLVENYLHFNLGNYSIIELVKQNNCTFFLKVFLN
ncbi:MAG TPA: hypothetical protein VNX01_03255 [Bacteroidia bacterium]|jgi:hypothetical protein|nr:hypothetical protein [Bacteroidia bacterium]